MREIAVFLAIILTISLFFVPITASNDNIRVILDGVELEFDVPPQIIDNRTLVPLRA